MVGVEVQVSSMCRCPVDGDSCATVIVHMDACVQEWQFTFSFWVLNLYFSVNAIQVFSLNTVFTLVTYMNT